MKVKLVIILVKLELKLLHNILSLAAHHNKLTPSPLLLLKTILSPPSSRSSPPYLRPPTTDICISLPRRRHFLLYCWLVQTPFRYHVLELYFPMWTWPCHSSPTTCRGMTSDDIGTNSLATGRIRADIIRDLRRNPHRAAMIAKVIAGWE